ncbi:membrane-associated protein [Jatrophihabitans sp. GAS493]|uniref:DedA family protein n=1 Tax=Jatrophihabitans sp. GAS493 TaxID=1907575 RepID=UPI000BB8F00E|nr:DedA family protein [Jatrophihabitans sp. GAS493]SOD74147.1 membrane-associated protein [Jatrophihabitans sp. GAS493]
MFEHIMTRIGDATGTWLYAIAAGLAFAEAAFLLGVVLPGETALLVAGVFCERGVLDLRIMIPVAIIAAIAGDSVGYEFGRKFGPALRRSRAGLRVGEPRWATVDAFLHKHGGKAVFLGRMTALLRALMPSMAGMSGMHYWTFLFWNALGGILWATGCVLLGYAFSSALGTIGSTLTWAPLAILAVAGIVYLVLHRRRRKREQAEGHSLAGLTSSESSDAE